MTTLDRSVVEVEIERLNKDVAEIKQSLKDIAEALTARSTTNWQTILSGVVVVIGLYAAAIHPLDERITKQEASTATLATAVIEQDKQRSLLAIDAAITKAKLELLTNVVTEVRTNGSPNMDRRVAVLESRR